MIVKPCPECEREDAGCACYPYYETQCRGCGSIVLGRTPSDVCYKCSSTSPFKFDLTGFP